MKYLLALVMLCGCAGTYVDFESRGPRIVGNDVRLQDVLEATPIFMGGGYICTAVAISENQAVTARHCILSSEGSTRVLAGVDGPHTVLAVTADPVYDVATMTVDAPFPHWFEPSKQPLIWGERVTVFGYGCDPAHRTLSEHAATVLGLNNEGNLRLETEVCLGDSGGPVLRGDGTVLGITVTKESDGTHSGVVPMYSHGAKVYP